MNDQPVYSIGAILTSFKLAIVAVATVLVAFLPEQTQDAAGDLLIAAVAAAAIFIGDLTGYILTRDRVTSIANPNLPVGTRVNENNPNEPTSEVTPVA